MKVSKARFLLSASVAVVASFTVSLEQAHAQAAAGARTAQVGGEESTDTADVIVTARRRAEALSNAPVALSVIGADKIEKLDIRTLEDITDRTPGVQFSSQAGLTPGRVDTAIRFRGMDTNQTAPSQQVGTIFLDGVYVATGVQSLDLSSVERVEIIKGPQSATYGRSTFGGAINYVMKTPSFTPKGRVSASLAEYGTYDIAASYEGPLIADKLAYRVSVRGLGTDGQYKSAVDGGQLGRERTLQGDFALYATPSDAVRLKFNAHYGEDRDGENSGVFLGSAVSNRGKGPAIANCNRLNPARLTQGVTDYYCGNVNEIVKAAGFSWDQLVSSNTVITPAVKALLAASSIKGVAKVGHVPQRTELGLSRDALRLSGAGEFDIGGGGFLENSRINVLAGYNRVGTSLVNDFDQTYVNQWLYDDPRFDKDVSTELRWSSDQAKRLRTSLGASYVNTKHIQGGGGGVLIYDYLTEIGIPTPFGTPTRDNPVTVYTVPAATETGKTLGFFGYVGFDITDYLTLDFEGRYQIDKIGQKTGAVEYKGEFKNFLPRVTLSYHPTRAGTIWATYSKGDLPGYFNSAIPGLTAAELAQVQKQLGNVGFFNDEEKLANYEAGVRQAFSDALNFSLVGYYMKWTNQKTRVGIPVVGATGATRFVSFQFNTGDSKLWGGEFEANWRASRNLSGSLSANYSGARYLNFTCAFAFYAPGNNGGRIACPGARPPKFPEWSGSAVVSWESRLDTKWGYYATLDGTYMGKAYNEETNYSWIGDTVRANLRVGIKTDSMRLEAFATNLFNNKDLVSAARTSDFTTLALLGFSTNLGIIATPPKKRTIGMRATFDF